MRWAWLRPGDNHDAGFLIRKARAWGIERVVFDAIDPDISKAYLADFRAKGKTGGAVVGVGITRSPDWEGGAFAGAEAFAVRLSQDLTRLGFDGSTRPDSCAAILNRETPHDPADQLAMLREWRLLRPTRLSAWAVEPMQGGWIGNPVGSAAAGFSTIGEFVNADPNLVVLGELYFGNPRMYPVGERAVVDDLRELGGIRPDRAKAYYDCSLQHDVTGAGALKAYLPVGWDGVAYDFGKLPDAPETGL